MSIDWNIVMNIAIPIISLFLGIWANQRFASRPMLISYFGHVSAFHHSPPGGQPINIHTHSVVLRNSGRKSATNVRLHHQVLPEFNIFPTVVYSVETLPDGSKDIVMPTMVPNEEITIAYFYFSPLTFIHINAGIKCDQCFAKQITVLLQRQYSRWFQFIAGVLMIAGLVAIIYLVYVVVFAAIR